MGGISSAFCLTPYLSYLRNALYSKYKSKTTRLAFDIYRLSVSFGILIGPIIGCLTYPHIESTLFILSTIALFLSMFGFILLKCFKWKRIKWNAEKSKPLLLADSNKCDEEENEIWETRYYPILQDDKTFCCCCRQTMCFFSFGVIFDGKYNKYQQIKKKFKQRRNDKKSRLSMDETTENMHTVTKKIQHKSKLSFAEGSVEHEYTDFYGNDGKTVTKDKVSILAQSRNTVLKFNQNELIKDNETESQSSSSQKLEREKSTVLTQDDIKILKEQNKNEMNLKPLEDRNSEEEEDVDDINQSNYLMNYQKYFQNNQDLNRKRGSSGSPSPPLPSKTRTLKQTFDSQHIQSFSNKDKNKRKSRSQWHRPARKRGWSSETPSVTETRSKTHTFLLLSDDDFASKQDDDIDLYQDVPEEDESFVQ